MLHRNLREFGTFSRGLDDVCLFASGGLGFGGFRFAVGFVGFPQALMPKPQSSWEAWGFRGLGI